MGKIVVFGADGFLGRHLVKKLTLVDPSRQIIAFDKFSSYQVGSGHVYEAFPNVHITPGDFFNRHDVQDSLVDCDYAFHLISTTNPATSIDDPFIDIDTNIRSSVELFELCVEANVKKMIFFSSGGTVYGNVDSSLISEQMVPRPQSPYGIGKLAIENYMRYFKNKHGLKYIVYRIANPYGPGQNIYGKQGVVPIFMHKFLNKEPVTVFGDGNMVRDYLYIDDLMNMVVDSYSKNNLYDEYNIGSGNGKTVNDLLKAIEDCTGISIEKSSRETPPTYVEKSVLDIKRFVDEFGLQPQISLEDGIRKTWDYVKEL
jgi:UDP-glucose 4-epimerase